MPTHDPARKRVSWRGVRRRRVKLGGLHEEEAAQRRAEDAELEQFDCDTLNGESAGITTTLQKMAGLLWAEDYSPLWQAEQRQLGELGLFQKSLELKAAAPPSTYTSRGLTRNIEAKVEKVAWQTGDLAAVALRQANQQRYPMSICARSISMLMGMMPVRGLQ